MEINGAVGIFGARNVCIDLQLGVINTSQWLEIGDENYSNNNTAVTAGIGGRVFFQERCYLGVSFSRNLYFYKDFHYQGMFITPCGGFLMPVVDNVFFDIEILNKMGMGKYSGDYTEDNKDSYFQVRAGFTIYFTPTPKKAKFNL